MHSKGHKISDGIRYLKRGWSAFFVMAMMLAGLPARAQDSLRTLAPDEFLALVRQYHPVAKQALIGVDIAKAGLLSARGAFDPLLYFYNDQKTFDGKNYFNYNHAALKIPTWFGVEIYAGLENNAGDLSNPELTLAQSSYAGLSVPLAKNLLMDNRRAVLAQSDLMVGYSEAEREVILNDLLMDAVDAYAYWAMQYEIYRVLTDAVRLNEERYELVRVTVEEGDRPGVDSTEALTQLLQFRFLQNQAWTEYLNAGYVLGNFLWTERNNPILLSETVRPVLDLQSLDISRFQFRPLADLLLTAREQHPKLRAFDYKLDFLEVERRLKFQSLLPTVNLKYNALTKGYEFWKGWNATNLQNNYKFGLEMGMPLILRQGRGDYRAAKLKIESTGLDLNAVRLDIDNKVKAYHNDLTNLAIQIRTNEQALEAYVKVYEVELMKFSLGESTLFLVNARENKVLEARQKLVELRAKFFKAWFGVQWSAGVLR